MRLGPGTATVVDPEAQRRRELLEAQNRALAACKPAFLRSHPSVPVHGAHGFPSTRPGQSQGEALVSGCVTELLENGDSVIRLLSEGVGRAQRIASDQRHGDFAAAGGDPWA